MDTIKNIGVVLGLAVAALGIFGGLLALPEKLKSFRKNRLPLGDQGTTYFLMSRIDSSSHTEAEFLVAEDVMHFLSAFGKAGGSNETLDIQKVGDFYRVRMKFAQGTLDRLTKVTKSK